MFVGLDVDEKDESVVVFYLLHGRLGGQWVLDDIVSIHAVNSEKFNVNQSVIELQVYDFTRQISTLNVIEGSCKLEQDISNEPK